MIKSITSFVALSAVLIFTSCNSHSTETVQSENETTMADSINGMATTNNEDPIRKLIDLRSGATVNVVKDEQSNKMKNAETDSLMEYYYDPLSSDTFDVYGRVVNLALVKTYDGKYTVDEAKIKLQSDGDLKMKSADGNTKVKIEANGDGKIKTDSSKVKVKNGEIIYKKN